MDIIKKIKSLERFQSISDHTIQAVADHCRCVEVNKGDILFHSSHHAEYVYFVLYGAFKLQDGDTAKNVVIYDFAGRGEFFGMIHSILRVPTYPFSAVALEDGAALEVPISDFNELLAKYPEFCELLQRDIGQRFSEIMHDRRISRLLVSQKLADFLLRTLQRPSLSCGGRITIPLTRVDLAKKIVTQEETVIRLLTAWTREGWISTTHKRIEVFDVAALERITSDVVPKLPCDEVVLLQGRNRLR
ncbi:MAG: Crp/Fnr family transcriptional regulator [Bdellovibrio sp.]|nr:Crp/Fnr family transcriptional regulator [Bdellovibrio sp.]